MGVHQMSTYRIVILGDPHISPSEAVVWEEEIIPDLNALNPDHVLVVGDLSGGPAGATHTTQRAVEVLSGLKAPWHSIIGNHDLEAKEFDSDEAAVAMMLNALGRSTPQFIVEKDDVAFIGLSNTFWRRNTVNHNEIVISDEQLAWLEGELERLGSKPVILLCHTPPIASGLMQMAELHGRVGNAVTNQNNEPSKLLAPLWKYPNICFWFSGHNHLGQHYRDTISQQLGVTFVHVGTAAFGQSRDGYRHSRILEIEENRIRIRTFDHGLRAIDPDLDYVIDASLPELVEARHRVLGKRYVPRDPATMRQPAPSVLRSLKKQRFAFLSDAHSIAPLAPIQKRVASWCSRVVKATVPDAVILGGDITHRAFAEQAEGFVRRLNVRDIPLHYIPGNNEGNAFCYPAGTEPAASPRTLGNGVWLLAITKVAEVEEAVRFVLQTAVPEGDALVFAHFPPVFAGEELQQQLQNAPARITWVCGHRHEYSDTTVGNLRIVNSGGLDPVKVRGTRPDLLQIDWDGSTAEIKRVEVEAKYIAPVQSGLHWLGVAFRGEAEHLLEVAIREGIGVLQFHYKYSWGEPSDRVKALVRQYRAQYPEGFLSLHLPNFVNPKEGVELAQQNNFMQFAEALQLNDVTIHLPAVPSAMLYQPDGSFQETEWAKGCLESYRQLAARALRFGGQISFENVYNKVVVPEGEEILGTKPWQLTRFVEKIRSLLREDGFSEEEVERVGIIFDQGHAFVDVIVSKQHGLADWLTQVGPYLQLLHVHQVARRTDHRGTKNHQEITSYFGPLVNFDGFLAALQDSAPRSLPLLLEIRDEKQALRSYRLLLQHTGIVRTI